MFENTTTHCTSQFMRDDPVFFIDVTVMFPMQAAAYEMQASNSSRVSTFLS